MPTDFHSWLKRMLRPLNAHRNPIEFLTTNHLYARILIVGFGFGLFADLWHIPSLRELVTATFARSNLGPIHRHCRLKAEDRATTNAGKHRTGSTGPPSHPFLAPGHFFARPMSFRRGPTGESGSKTSASYLRDPLHVAIAQQRARTHAQMKLSKDECR